MQSVFLTKKHPLIHNFAYFAKISLKKIDKSGHFFNFQAFLKLVCYEQLCKINTIVSKLFANVECVKNYSRERFHRKQACWYPPTQWSLKEAQVSCCQLNVLLRNIFKGLYFCYFLLVFFTVTVIIILKAPGDKHMNISKRLLVPKSTLLSNLKYK